MSGYQCLTSWSIVQNCRIARVSMVDANGDEFFCIIRNEGGKAYREVRERALDAIEDAIAENLPAGEVQPPPIPLRNP